MIEKKYLGQMFLVYILAVVAVPVYAQRPPSFDWVLVGSENIPFAQTVPCWRQECRTLASTASEKAEMCNIALDLPEADAQLTLPAEFAWTVEGPCGQIYILFKSDASEKILSGPVAEDSLTLDYNVWQEIKSAIGQGTTYAWTIAYADGENLMGPPWRPFVMEEVSGDCSASLSTPEDAAAIALPHMFSWTRTGDCGPTYLGFAAEGTTKVAIRRAANLSYELTLETMLEIETVLGKKNVYFWTLGTINENAFTALTEWRSVVMNIAPEPCVLTPQTPEDGALITLPQTFSWTKSGDCPPRHIGFKAKDADAVAVALTSEESFALTEETMKQLKDILGDADWYAWSPGSFAETFIPAAPWRFFTDKQAMLSATPAVQTVSAEAGSLSIAINNTGKGEMHWTARVVAGESWLTLESGAEGINSGTATLAYAANAGKDRRVGEVEFTAATAGNAPVRVQITQKKQGLDLLGCLGCQKTFPGNSQSWNRRWFGDLILLGLGLAAAAAWK